MRLTEEQYQQILAGRRRPATMPAPAKKRSKYGNTRVVIDGRRFDSIKEADRYQELRLLERSGQISGLECQVRYPITVAGIEVCEYRADFVYADLTGAVHVEDVKSKATRGIAVYRLKKRLMLACHGIEIEELL